MVKYNTMEEDKLKEFLINFEPEISSDFSFMSKLQHHLDQVEMIKQHNSDIAVRRKKAVVIAACVGFIAGFLFSLVLPYITTLITDLQLSLPSGSTIQVIADNYLTIAWLIIGGFTVFISLNTYELSLSILSRKGKR